ncbi:hypothetical protein [Mycobacterium sp. DL592]|uniref:hypothetical protein n=1 Tax=Mycobacterium sp. DL592 TaxID=2675524 RepID=UPI001AAE21F3|nr:hypothetical protein [Mycobacterium sp. DL592]
MAANTRVAVGGRAGCGRRTVSRALRAAGVEVVAPEVPHDVDVYVLAETAKPEDLAVLTAPLRPCVAVLNKADLTGFGGQGPVAAAAERCRQLQDAIGSPVLPLAGLAALAALDGSVLDQSAMQALQTLTTEPADLSCTDGFVTGEHPVPAHVRARLLAGLDLFGIAHAVRALRDGADRAGVMAALRHASAVDGLLTAIHRLSAAARYRRLVSGLAADSLGNDTVLAARMAAAIEVVEADGMHVDRTLTEQALLRRARDWQRYSRGPVSRLHQSCGSDIVRGSLRLWERAGGVPEPPEPQGRRHRTPEPQGRRHRALP